MFREPVQSDLARIDERGYVRIAGRTKDVIIRGGENIPVVEVESLLCRRDRNGGYG